MNNFFIYKSCVLFRAVPNGEVDQIPYCPICEKILTIGSGGVLLCDLCVFYAPINAAQLPEIIRKINF